LLIFSSAAYAEDILPPGTRIIMSDGTEIVLPEERTLIGLKEKEVLVRNDDLWQVDQQTILALQEKIRQLEGTGGIDAREIDLLKRQLELERERSAFYKEQLEVTVKISKETQEKLMAVIKETKPSIFQEIVNKGGWVGLLLAIGVILGLAL